MDAGTRRLEKGLTYAPQNYPRCSSHLRKVSMVFNSPGITSIAFSRASRIISRVRHQDGGEPLEPLARGRQRTKVGL